MSVFGNIKESFESRTSTRRVKKLKKLEKERTREEKKQSLVERKLEITGLKKETRERKNEAMAKKYGRTWDAGGTAKRAGIKTAKFVGELAHEGAKSYGTLRSTMEKKGRRGRATVRATSTNRSFVAPDGGDISLSGAIAFGDWSGGKNVMNTEFFGEGEQRELMGDNRDLLGDTKEKQWNMDIFGSTNGHKQNVDYLSGNGKKKNRKFF